MVVEYRNNLFLEAVQGRVCSRPPVWLMRQAGRYDPQYQDLRSQCGLSLYQLFRHPELATRISLLPRRLGVDALIFFQDILTVLAPMGAEFNFDGGVRLVRPLADYLDLRHYDVSKELSFVPETLRQLTQEVDGEMPILGFAGAPLTLAVFLLEGGSFAGGKGAKRFRRVLQSQRQRIHVLLQKLTRITVDYLDLQIEAGVAAVQLFESAADLLSVDEYEEFALPYHQEIFSRISGTTTILFAKNFYDLQLLRRSGATIINLPSGITFKSARQVLGDNIVLQGNLSNYLLATSSVEQVQLATKACIADGGCHNHIVNLDHGILPQTPFKNVETVIQTVREG